MQKLVDLIARTASSASERPPLNERKTAVVHVGPHTKHRLPAYPFWGRGFVVAVGSVTSAHSKRFLARRSSSIIEDLLADISVD